MFFVLAVAPGGAVRLDRRPAGAGSRIQRTTTRWRLRGAKSNKTVTAKVPAPLCGRPAPTDAHLVHPPVPACTAGRT